MSGIRLPREDAATAEVGEPGRRLPDQLPDQVTMGLLAYITSHALEDDYDTVARRRPGPAAGEAPEQAPPKRSIGVLGAVAVLVFALLVATAAAQTSRNSSTDEQERRDLVTQIGQRKVALAEDRARVAALTAQNDRLEAARLRGDNTTSGVFDRLRLLGMRNGNVAVRGPGVRVVVDNGSGAAEDPRLRVLDTDLQQLANGLWEAGAEAIAINGERLTNLSAIRHAGSAITVNFQSLSRPYTVEAIGDPDRLPARFAETTSGRTWLDLQRQIGLSFEMRTMKSMTLPGEPQRHLRYAKPLTPTGKRVP